MYKWGETRGGRPKGRCLNYLERLSRGGEDVLRSPTPLWLFTQPHVNSRAKWIYMKNLKKSASAGYFA